MAKLRPLWTPGGARGASIRPGNLPSMVSPVPANAVSFFEDFHNAPVGKINYTDSGGDTGPYGNPGWVVASIGTANSGTAGCAQAVGNLLLFSGTTSGDGLICEPGGRSALSTLAGLGTTTAANAMWRINTGANATTTCIQGLGWVGSGLTMGTDWITDPATTFNGVVPAVIIHRNTTVSSGAFIAYVYDGSVLLDSGTLVASPAANTTYKFEVAFDPTAVTYAFYVNGVLTDTLDGTGTTTMQGRPSFGVKTLTAAFRSFSVDCYYQEVGQANAR